LGGGGSNFALGFITVCQEIILAISSGLSLDTITKLQYIYIYISHNRVTAVGIATGYGLDDNGVGIWVPVEVRIFTSPRPDWLWGPASLLFNGYGGPFPAGKAAGAWSWSLTSN
jgi:hypothetical protein